MAPKHIFLAGLPGSGKTTEGKRLSAETGLPLISLDNIPPQKGERYPDTKAARRFIKKELATPHIVEGVQILPFSRKELAGHDVRLLDTPREVIINRLLQRGWEDERGYFLQGEEHRAEAEALVEELTPALNRFRNRLNGL